MFLVNTVLPFLVILAVLVGIHELGHYLAARYHNIAVKRFSIGFGPIIWRRKDKNGTEWALSCIPLGGYVSMVDKPGERAVDVAGVSYADTSRGARASVIAAGPLANVILGFVLLTGWASHTLINAAPPIIERVVENSPAQAAGLLAGDRVLKVNNTTVQFFSDIGDRLRLSLNSPAPFVVQRGNDIVHLTITPVVQYQEIAGRRVPRGTIGIHSIASSEVRKATWSEVPGMVLNKAWDSTFGSLGAIGQIFTGQRSTDNMQGVVGMAQMTSYISHSLTAMIGLAALISLNLALFNLLPVPVLDGGHLFVLGVESVLRRDLPDARKEFAMKMGMALLASLFLLTFLQDIYYLALSLLP